MPTSNTRTTSGNRRLRHGALLAPALALTIGCGEESATSGSAPDGDGGLEGAGAGSGTAGGVGAGAAFGGGGTGGTGAGSGGDSSAGGTSQGGTAGAGTGGAATACRHQTFRDDAYAFELRIVNTSRFYKVDFPRELMPHCVAQRNASGETDPDALETRCEASYLFKKDADVAPASPVTESFDIVIPYVPAAGFDLTIARGGDGTTTYEIGGLDGTTWLSFDSSQDTVHIPREALTPGGLAARIPAPLPVGPKRGAYLFPWYGAPDGPAGRWVHWDPAAPTLYIPTKGEYDSADVDVIAQQMSEARSAGLDLFVVSYWDLENPPFSAYLDAAAREGIEISAMLETATRSAPNPRESVRNQLATLVDSFGSHPAWLKGGGKPIVFVYDRVTSDIDTAPVGATGWEDWQWIAADLGDRTPVIMFPLGSQWAEEGATLFGGAFAFAANSGGDSFYNGSHGDDWNWAVRARWAGALLAIPILPSIGRLREPGDSTNFGNQWHAARSVMPDMIIVNSWNEYHESTIIEPTTAFGTEYLDLTREEGDLYCRGEQGSLIQ